MTGFPSDSFASQVGGFASLFAGVAVIASIAIVLLRKRPSRWALPALVAAAVAWALSWLGMLVRSTSFASSLGMALGVAYWVVLFMVGLMIVGTIVSLLASRRGAAAPDECNGERFSARG